MSHGRCHADDMVRAAKIMLHRWEEPCICGGSGAGAIFFTGCPLGCVYCQNGSISRGELCGKAYTVRELADAMLSLQEEGACCIDLVSPTQYTPQILDALDLIRGKLTIPVVWNTGGYEKPDCIRQLDGYVDIYLTDFKYASSEISAKYSRAPDYPQYAAASLREMYSQVGAARYDGEMMVRGVIVRHLVLPGSRNDSIAVMRRIADCVPVSGIVLSLMRQYTPDFLAADIPALRRRVTSFEYDTVLDAAHTLGFVGYSQDKASADSSFTPEF